MRKSLFVLFLSLSAMVQASAASLPLTLNNQSGDVITGLSATAIGAPDATPLSLLAAAIPAGESSDITVQAEDGQCLFNLTFTFASGKTADRPGTDLCQTDGIVVE